MTDAPAPPRPATTTVLLRPGAPFEVFLIKRVMSQQFMGGSHVFPGGRLDAADRAVVTAGLIRHARAAELARSMQLDVDEALAYLVAGARELLEEAGVLLAEGADVAKAASVRAALVRKTPFAEALRSEGLVLDGEATRYLAHWVTPVIEPRRFTARFFVARLPEGQEATVDNQEATVGEWLVPAQALKAQEEGQIVLPPPTLCVLHGLSRQASLDAALAGARHPVVAIEPVFHTEDETPVLVFPGDVLHPVADGEPGAPTRVALVEGRWVPRILKRVAP